MVVFALVKTFLIRCSYFLKSCQLRVTAGKGIQLHPVVMKVQLTNSFSLITQHICEVVPDHRLDGTSTMLKALLRAGLPLNSSKANGDPISITYCSISPDPSRCGNSDANPVDEEKEFEVILPVLQVVHMMANRWIAKDCWRSVPRLLLELFINERLMGKLNRQLQEAALVVGKCFPAWCEHLATAFGSDRLMHMLAEAQREDAESFLWLAEQKSAMKLAASHQVWVILEIQFVTRWELGRAMQWYFRTLGWITAKSLFDSYTMDLPLSEAFLELLVGGAEKLERFSALRIIKENLDVFIDATLDFLTGTGGRYAITSFQEGFNMGFPLCKLAIFSPCELNTIVGNAGEDWSAEDNLDSATLPI
ncbi:Ubiquitin fusion degradation protein 4, partial [Massospora cicadina]